MPQRLAMAYVPASARVATLVLLGLDHRLGRAVAQASEPIMAQMRLAWWRDVLRQPVAARPASDGLVAVLSCWEGEEASLIALVDAWEEMLAEPPLPASAAVVLVEARAVAFGALAQIVGASEHTAKAADAGRVWALGDLAAGLGNSEEREMAVSMRDPHWGTGTGLPRVLRPLAMLARLADRGLAKGGAPLLDGLGAVLLAMRIGIAGR